MDIPWKVDGCTDKKLAEAYFNSWQSANKEVCRLETLIAEKNREIARLAKALMAVNPYDEALKEEGDG